MGSVLKGRAEKQAAYAAGDQALVEARIRAASIRRLADQVRGEATGAYAASGVDVTQGSPLEVDRVITRNSEQDALNTIIGGQQQRRSLRDSGVSAQRGGYFGAASALAAGAYQYGEANAWKTAARSPQLAGARTTYQSNSSSSGFTAGLA